MLAPLIILAFLSIAGGYVGVPGSLGGHNLFDKFLGPVFRATAPAVNAEHAQTGESPEQQTEAEEPKTGYGTELIFTGISVAAGILGFLLALWLYWARNELPQQIAAAAHGLYSAVVNKYWIDEFYAWIFVKPLVAVSSVVF